MLYKIWTYRDIILIIYIIQSNTDNISFLTWMKPTLTSAQPNLRLSTTNSWKHKKMEDKRVERREEEMDERGKTGCQDAKKSYFVGMKIWKTENSALDSSV